MTDFSTIELEDFDDPVFCKTYIAHHGGEICPPHELDKVQNYTFCWSYGFLDATPACYSEYYADLFACVFIRWFLYRKDELDPKDEFAVFTKPHQYVYEKMKKNGYTDKYRALKKEH